MESPPKQGFRFDRMELAGSVGDLGTLLPLALGMILINGLSVSAVLLAIGLFYIAAGWYYRLPIPVQPLKVMAAIAIADPLGITPPVIVAATLLFGVTMLLLGATGLINRIHRWFSPALVRGIQLGLGLILIHRGVTWVTDRALVFHDPDATVSLGPLPLNPLIGIAIFFLALLLLSNKRFPAGLVVVGIGWLLGLLLGPGSIDFTHWGPTALGSELPQAHHFLDALILLVIPQLPLTVSNAVIGTADTACALFPGPQTQRRVSVRALCTSMAGANFLAAALGGIPMCHGAGGLAAHYRFGARTGGSNLMIGALFVVMALALGEVALSALMLFPQSVLGVLLVLAGIELALLVRDIRDRSALFITLLVAGVALATTNVALGFGVGLAVEALVKRGWVRLG